MGFFQNKKQSMDYYCSKINNQISIDEAEKILKISKEKNWTSISSRLIKMLAFKLFDNKKFAQSFDYFLYYVNIHDDIYSDPESAAIFNKMGICENYLNEIDEAIVYLKKAEVTARKFNNLDELNKIYFNLSIAYGKSKDYELSLHCIQKSLNIFSSIENTSYYVYAKSCEANCYVSLKQLDKAISIYKNLLKDIHIDKTTAYLYNNLACIYIEKGDYKNAETYNNKSYALRESSDKNSLSQTMKTKAYIYETKEMYDEAISILNNIISCDTGYDCSVKIDSYKMLISLYQKIKRYDLEKITMRDLKQYIISCRNFSSRISYYKIFINFVANNLKNILTLSNQK